MCCLKAIIYFDLQLHVNCNQAYYQVHLLLQPLLDGVTVHAVCAALAGHDVGAHVAIAGVVERDQGAADDAGGHQALEG